MATFAVALACQAVFGDYEIDASGIVQTDERCSPGESRCAGATLQTCAPDGFGFDDEITCASPALCNVDTEGCTPCTPGQFQCNGAVLRQCAPDATWTEIRTCASRGLCMVSDDKRSGSCMETCEPGTFRCTDGALERCSREGESWDFVEQCASDALCNVELATQQAASGAPAHCSPPACQSGEYTCEGGAARRCKDTLDGWDRPAGPCNPKEWCNPKDGTCNACKPGEHACSGGTPFTCNASGTWEADAPCASPSLCDVETGTCLETKCDAPGAYRCDASTLLLERCRTDLANWDAIDSCASFDLCNATEGRCEPAACRIGAVRCQGSRLEQCTGNLTGWRLLQTCKSGELCTPEEPTRGCTRDACSDGAMRCNERFLERCAKGAWERVDRCNTPELCNAEAGRCQEPACIAREFICTGVNDRTLMRCDPGGTMYVYLDTCVAPERCDAAAGECR